MTIISRDHANLVSLWTFEDDGNLGNDAVGSNDLTNTNSVAATSPYNAKQGFYAADFEKDSSRRLSITDAAQSGLDITGQITVCCWVKFESLSYSAFSGPYFCGKSTTSGNQHSWSFGAIENSGNYRLQAVVSSTGSGTTSITGSTNLVASRWYHCAFIKDGTNLNILLNGLPDATPVGFASSLFNSTSPFQVGNRGDSQAGFFMDGLIDELAIFNTGLSESDINDIMGYGIYAVPRTFFISNAGNNGNAGTSQGASWQTTVRLNQGFEDEEFGPGDWILFNRGDDFSINASDRVILPRNCRGTINRPIGIGAYGTGPRPRLNNDSGEGEDCFNQFGSGSTGWERRATHMVIQDLEITAFDGDTSNANGIGLQESHHFLLQRLYIHDCHTIDVANRTVSGFHLYKETHHMIVRSNVVRDIDGEGIYFAIFDDPEFTCWIYWCIGNTVLDADGEGIEIKPTGNYTYLIRNYVARCGSYGANQIRVCGFYHRVFRNYVYGQRGSCQGGISIANPPSGTGTQVAGSFCLVERNLIRDQTGTDGGLELKGDGNKARNNVLTGNARGIGLGKYGAASNDNEIYNNLFDNNTIDLYRVDGATSDFQIDNNGYADGPGGIWYWSGTRDFSYVQGTLGFEPGGLTSDPDVANTGQYILNLASPYIDQGDSAETSFDWAGSEVDIGWWEVNHRNFSFAVFESLFDDLTGWTTSGAASVSPTAKNKDTNGLLVAVSTTAANVTHDVDTDGASFRFQVNLDNVSAAVQDSFKIFYLRNASAFELAFVEVRKFSDGWRARASINDDGTSSWSTAYFALTSGWNEIELWWLAARDSHPVGEITLWINGGSAMIPVAAVEDMNNDGRGACATLTMGTIAPIPATCSGSLYLTAVTAKWEYVGPHSPVRLNDPHIQAYFAMPGSSNLGLDSSPNGNTLNNSGASFTTTAYLSQGAADFEAGSSTYLSISHASQIGLQLQPPFSFMFRTRFESEDVGMGILSKQDTGGTTNLSYALRRRFSDNRLELQLSSNGTTTTLFQNDSALYSEVWYCIHVVVNGIDVRFYVDGVLDSVTPGVWSSSLFASTGTFYVGKVAADYMDGILDSIFIFNRELTAAEAWWTHHNHVDGEGEFTDPPGTLIFIPEYINYTPAGFGML